MQTASCFLLIDSLKNNVPKVGVTPAEAILLTREFQPRVQDIPFTAWSDPGTVARSSSEEFSRLANIYGPGKVSKCFPGDLPTFPETFEAAKIATGLKWPEPVKPAAKVEPKA